MSSFYINSMYAITAQRSDFLTSEESIELQGNVLKAIDEEYKSVIRPMTLRRMSKAVKMSLFSAIQALKKAGLEKPDSILVGTGQGCMQDTEKFMQHMSESEAQLLSPTSFIQSTHNTVSGQIALYLKCMGQNMTYTQNSVSFESCLLDAQLQFELDKETDHILVGAVDETSPEFTYFQKLDGQIKSNLIKNTALLDSQTAGTLISESCAFFSISRERTSTSIAVCKAVRILNFARLDEVEESILQFLGDHDLDPSRIDAVILGNNGDSKYDQYYQGLQEGIFNNSSQLSFKNFTGDNNSISAIGFALGVSILQHQRIPGKFQLNKKIPGNLQRILIYNQYLGRNHGFILLESLEI